MARIGRRDAAVAAIIALAAGLATALPAFDRVRGLSLDALTSLRWHLFGAARRADSPTAVVALDEETYRTPPFANTPNITWTPEIARVLTAVIDGGAKVVGFDIVYPISIEQSEIPFGDDTLGGRVRGFDRDFLRALALGARANKVVLGQVQLSAQPIVPAPGQRIAVGQQRNIRALNVYTDPDDVVRRLPLSFVVDGERVPSMAVELAARALQAAPEFRPDGRMTLGGYGVPSATPNTMTINFPGGVDDVPTYSLADLRACVEKGDATFFQRAFDGKVVVFGTLLDAEDRKLTSKRFAAAPEAARAERCVVPRPADDSGVARNTTSGVYIHAAAINNLIRQNAVTETGRAGAAAVAMVFAALMAAVALGFAPLGAGLAYGAGALAWTAVAVATFRNAVALPLVEPFVAGLAAMVATIAYRFMVADKDKRFLRKSFALYLAPSVIEKMVASNKLPVLGGETRLVTVYFSDVAGFSTLAEKLGPAEIVSLMNAYLSEMTDIIEAYGGFVYQYVGDAIVALFGAPLDDPRHADNAVRAALDCARRLDDINRDGVLFKGRRLGQRIGLNSGEVLVGNVGSRRRLSYTAMGDAVNLASRLEGASKFYRTTIIASDATVALTGAAFLWRELDTVRVIGRAEPVRIYEPLAVAGQETAEQSARAAAYANGLARWRVGDFAQAAASFARFAETDPPFAAFAERARRIALRPPGAGWDAITTLEGK
jgi:class 3 adenylate cyclase/CHASE2 domain-containing sensor protein